MFSLIVLIWIAGSLALIGCVGLARRRRGALARELHELRGSLTAARLAVDLMPVLDLDRPTVCRAASDELERSYRSLGEFEDLLHSRLVQPPFNRSELADAAAARRARRSRIDARIELERLALIWREAADRKGRRLDFIWEGPESGVMANGPRRPFVEVVANLLSNALQHGEGLVTLHARMRTDVLRIEVKDEGPGMRRSLRGESRRASGPHGHGLSIALAAARRLGGSVTSAPGVHGATVVFTVPATHDVAAVQALALGNQR